MPADPVADYWSGFLAPRSRTTSTTALATRRRLTGPAVQYVHDTGQPRSGMILDSLDRASRPIAPTPPVHSALRSQPDQQSPTGSSVPFEVSGWKFNSRVAVCGPIIRRGKGSARGDFQGENREPMVQDVPPARSREGATAGMQEVEQCREQLPRFLSEGSPKGRMGKGP
jgi:hypothetical protein